MDQAAVDGPAGAWPGTDLSEPFGPGIFVWKVGGKMFAAYGHEGVTLKCSDRDSAEFLIEIGAAERPRYFTRGGWVRIRWGDAALPERLRTSYETVRDGLPRRVRATLG